MSLTTKTKLPQLTLNLSLPQNFGFKNFVTGENSEAIYTLKNYLTMPVENIYLYGSSGVGKTHLLHALCSLAEENGKSSIYLPGKDLINFQPTVLDGLAEIDLVCFDDIDIFAGKNEWERAVMVLFNLLKTNGKRFVMTAKNKAQHSGIQLADLSSRLAWGYVFQLKSLSDNDFAKALVLQAKEKGIELSDEVSQYLSKRCPRQMHKALNIIDILDKTSLSQKKKITIPFIKTVLGW